MVVTVFSRTGPPIPWGNCVPTEFPEDLNNPYQGHAGQCDAPGQAVETWVQGIDISPLLTHACMQRVASVFAVVPFEINPYAISGSFTSHYC